MFEKFSKDFRKNVENFIKIKEGHMLFKILTQVNPIMSYEVKCVISIRTRTTSAEVVYEDASLRDAA